jgi:hypothetical protein
MVQRAAPIKERGVFDRCSNCGANVLYYSDHSVRCEGCAKLYGSWIADKNYIPKKSVVPERERPREAEEGSSERRQQQQQQQQQHQRRR